MLTYDSFAFIQITFVAFILLGLGAAACRLATPDWTPGQDTRPGDATR